jgi:hypothetical protein
MAFFSIVFFYGVVPYASFRGAMRVTGSVLASSIAAVVATLVVSFGAERIFKTVSDRRNRG